MAIRELLRLMWAEDRVWLDNEFLCVSKRLGPFTKTRQLARDQIRRVFICPGGSGATALMTQLDNGSVTLADLGTPEDRANAAIQLRTALGLDNTESSVSPASLPDAWQEIMDLHGHILLVPNLKTRRTQALIVSVITILAWTGTVLLAWHSQRDPNLLVATIMVAVATVWITKQALWLHRGRNEWRIEKGRLIYQRRNGDQVKQQLEARALELVEWNDSDNDRWYELKAVALSLPSHTTHMPFSKPQAAPKERKIDRSIHDPTGPRSLGHWLSNRARIPFHDRVPDDARRRAETAKTLDQLARSGKLGHLLARWLSRMQPPENDGSVRQPDNRQDGSV